MATEQAPPRRLWQLPTFLVGVAALVALWHYGDRIRPSLSERYERAMLVLRPAVDRWPPDPDQVQAAIRKLPDSDPPAELAPKVKYLKGSAYVALAEASTSPSEAAEYWPLALRNLEEAADHDLPVPDQKKLRYRLARTWAHTPGTDPKRTIEALSKYVSAGDDPSEGHRLLSELYRSTTPANDAGERDALQNFLRHASPRADAKMLNGARLRLAELHARLGSPEDARKVLDRVGAESPPEMFAAARLRRGGLYWTEEDYAKAAYEWEQVRGMKGATEPQRVEALVRLAEAYVKLGRSADAERIVQEMGKPDSAEGRAVTFRKAEVALQDPNSDIATAIAELEKAFAGADVESLLQLIPATDARRVCEAAFTKARTSGDFPLALRVTKAYARVAEIGDHYRLIAELHLAWAESLAKDSATALEATTHYRESAEACMAAAQAEKTVVGRVDWSRKAVRGYLKANEPVKAIGVLTDMSVRLSEYPAAKVGEVWTEVGEGFQAAGNTKQAIKAFQNASLHSGQNRASVKLAALEFEADPIKGGAAAIEIISAVFTSKPESDPATVEEARFLLGEIHLIRKEWEQSESALKAAIETHPNSQKIARARYQYGQVLRHSAYEEARKIKTDRAVLEQIRTERITLRQPKLKAFEEIRLVDGIDRVQTKYEEKMRQAYEEFCKAEDLLLSSPDTADPSVVQRTSFWAADCAYWLGEFTDCAARCDKLAVRYRGRIEELEANRDLHRCCTFAIEATRLAKDVDGTASWTKRGKDAKTRLQDALSKLPLIEFDGTSESRRREYWEMWSASRTP